MGSNYFVFSIADSVGAGIQHPTALTNLRESE